MAVVEVQLLEQFLAEVERAALDFPGSAGIPIIRPKKHEVLPYLWRGPEIERLLRQSERVALGERRMLRLANPGTPGWKYVTQTMSVSIQQILPGELAVPHRHAANAIPLLPQGERRVHHRRRRQMRDGTGRFDRHAGLGLARLWRRR